MIMIGVIRGILGVSTVAHVGSVVFVRLHQVPAQDIGVAFGQGFRV